MAAKPKSTTNVPAKAAPRPVSPTAAPPAGVPVAAAPLVIPAGAIPAIPLPSNSAEQNEAERVAKARALLHERIDSDFTYLPPRGEPQAHAGFYVELLDYFRALSHYLVNVVPPCSELEAALKSLKEAVTQANAGVKRHG